MPHGHQLENKWEKYIFIDSHSHCPFSTAFPLLPHSHGCREILQRLKLRVIENASTLKTKSHWYLPWAQDKASIKVLLNQSCLLTFPV